MDNNDISTIEQALDLKLPQEYRQVLFSYPFEAGTDIYDRDLYHRVEAIIEQNKMHRELGFFGQKWPEHYLVIGNDLFGNLHFMDLTRPEGFVFFADHEDTTYSSTIEAEEEAASLSEWVKATKEREARVRAEHEQWMRSTAERKRNKRWWQFWI